MERGVGAITSIPFKSPTVGAPGWLSWLSVQLRLRISWFVSLSPMSGSVLTARSLEPASDSVSFSLCPSPTCALSL